jgi:transcriptional regulator with XRE-family HTH domain
MSSKAFGQFIKKLRLRKGITLREFCHVNGFDPGNFSRLERGLLPPPQREDLLEKYALALDLQRGSDEWTEFFDQAAAAKGQLPQDLLSDAELLEKLPLLFRTLRGRQVSAEKLDQLMNKVRRG